MKLTFAILALFVVCGNAATLPQSLIQGSLAPPAINEDLINDVNSKATTWKAGKNEFLEGKTVEDVKRLLGTRMEDIPAHIPRVSHKGVSDVPSDFDSRTQWPNCIGPVLNQGDCGSCWAFGAAETASDRLCIGGGNGATFQQLAPLDLVECDKSWLPFSGNNGCHGGNLGPAFDYIKSTGLASETCFPYLKSDGGPIPTCTADQQPCTTFVNEPKCAKTCHDGSSIERTKLSNVYSVSGVEDMKKEIATNGPVESAFTVYEDFVHYKSGVYKHTSGSALGGHAIKVIGYGTENGEEYFLVQNSWTTSWGDGGYFKIGVNECGISSQGVTGKP